MNDDGAVRQIQVKQRGASSNWIWGAIKMPGRVFHALHRLWLRAERQDEYFGTLVNAWLAEGGAAVGVKAGREYVDVGTLHGYRAAVHILEQPLGEKRTSENAKPEEKRADERVTVVHD